MAVNKNAVNSVKEKAEKVAQTVKTEAKTAKKVVKEKVKTGVETAKKNAKNIKKAADSKKESVFIQFDGKEISLDTVIESAKADFKTNNSRSPIRSINVYIKPEDNAAYYVINSKNQGKIDL